ncbi:glycosyltransferase family 29 protein [Marimonas arenosa]|uniref:Glycosyltransferase family 29 protein n=2 Tax=Pseudomonadati TaxID=3379134 RepID=A0AAE4B4Q3_9RHOB|nr:glycosyltransferase family 29 protein [Marimonas arenosa]MDQ2090470.1 glycosyltransferase family 29 protein [Marimonas arenosa]
MDRDRVKAWPRKYLYQAPRALFLKLARNSDRRLARYIGERSVAVVGNARSLLDTEFGARIDAEGVVVRLNKGFVRAPAAQGRRTDIVSLSPEVTAEEIDSQFAPDLICLLTPKLRHLHLTRRDQLRRVLFYPFSAWTRDRRLIGRRPSSGFMMISWLLRLGFEGRITLYGFDFGATETYYNPAGYQTPHDFAAEGRLIQKWEAEGRLTIVRS